MILALVSMVGWFALTSFFWLRGIWRNNASDLVLGVVLLCIFAITSRSFLPEGASEFGIMSLGILTMIVGPLGRRIPFQQASFVGIALIVLGVFLALLL